MMMLVLVLRGLTGTAMAAGMVPPVLPAALQTASAHPHPAAHLEGHDHAHVHGHGRAHGEALSADGHAEPHGSHAMKLPCHGGGPADCADQHAGNGHHAGKGTCSACEICHSAMLALPLVQTTAAVRAGTPLPDASAQFHSAPAAQALEPPIA